MKLGASNWKWKKNHHGRSETFEENSKCNQEIRNNTGKKRLGVTVVLHYIQKQHIKWFMVYGLWCVPSSLRSGHVLNIKLFGHLTRLPPGRILLKILILRIVGNTGRDRPRGRWMEVITDALNVLLCKAELLNRICFLNNENYMRKERRQTLVREVNEDQNVLQKKV